MGVRRSLRAGACAWALAGAAWAGGPCGSELDRVDPVEPVLNDLFGQAVALAGTLVIVGSPTDDDQGLIDCGSVSLYRISGGTCQFEDQLFQPGGESFDHFGWSVAGDDDVVVVGAPNDDHSEELANAGTAYVFRRVSNQWTLEATLTAPLPGALDRFGVAVAIRGDTILVGASMGDHEGVVDAGVVHVYRFDGEDWAHGATLAADDASPGAEFGVSVAFDGVRAIVGAANDGGEGIAGAGAAYVFTDSGALWPQAPKILAPALTPGANFGTGVAIDGATILVGAPLALDGMGEATGSAFVLTDDGSGWTHAAMLLASDRDEQDRFGAAVSLAGSLAIVGAPRAEDPPGSNRGAAYVYFGSGGSWSQSQRVLSSDPVDDGLFGTGVAIGSGVGLVGAPRDRAGGVGSGVASLIDLAPCSACVAPSITSGPSGVDVCWGGEVELSVEATGTTLGFQWRNGAKNIIGATQSTYTIPSAVQEDSGSYDVVVSNGCGSQTSAAAAVDVDCRIDFTCNDTLDTDDFVNFLILFSTASPRADLNSSGNVDSDDFISFLVLFAAGCP